MIAMSPVCASRSDHFGGGLRLVPIAVHHLRPLMQSSAVSGCGLANRGCQVNDLAVGIGKPNPIVPHAAHRTVHVGHGSALRQAVALNSFAPPVISRNVSATAFGSGAAPEMHAFTDFRSYLRVSAPRFELHMVLKQLAKERPSFFPGVPRLYVALNEAPETRKYDLKSVKACISGAAPLPKAVADTFREITGGAKLVEGYGLTECAPVTHVNPFDAPHPGTIGIPLPDTDCKIVDLDNPDREVAPGDRGELCIKGRRSCSAIGTSLRPPPR